MQSNILDQANNEVEVLSAGDIQQARNKVVQSAKDFKNSWRNLANSLHVAWSNKLYKQWGYETFDNYTAKEISIRKHTAMKLIRSYQFLHQEKLEYFKNELSQEKESRMPSLEVVNTLQRAKKQLPQDDYDKIKKSLFEEKKDVGQVKKDLTALIMNRRKDLNPQEERTKKGKVAVNSFLEALHKFKRDIESLKILPSHIAQDIDSLIEKICECNTQEKN